MERKEEEEDEGALVEVAVEEGETFEEEKKGERRRRHTVRRKLEHAEPSLFFPEENIFPDVIAKAPFITGDVADTAAATDLEALA